MKPKTILLWLFVGGIIGFIVVMCIGFDVFEEWWKQFHLFEPSTWTGDNDDTKNFFYLMFVLVLSVSIGFVHKEIMKKHNWYKTLLAWYDTYSSAFWAYIISVATAALASAFAYEADDNYGQSEWSIIYVIYSIAIISFIQGFCWHRQISKRKTSNYINENQNATNTTQIAEEGENAKYEKIAKEVGILAAVKAYKEDHNCCLSEAQNAIDSLLAPKPSATMRPFEEYEKTIEEKRQERIHTIISILIFVVPIFSIIFYKVWSNRTENEKLWAAGPKNYVERAFNVNMKMVYVEGGNFMMGCSDNDSCISDQKPERHVSLNSYFIGMTEVTQQQWQKVMGTSITDQRLLAGDSIVRCRTGNKYPMHYVSWEEANEFCRRLSQKSKHTYQLPTESQWEYAARGGINNDTTPYSGGFILDSVSWNHSNSGRQMHPVGTRQCNSLAICDMSGNVWEYCLDCYADTYNPADTIDPCGPATGDTRVLRGGSFLSKPKACEVRNRDYIRPNKRVLILGFRVVMIP
ncbi:MAG: formylglycine-generating enzyme family protein [Salinivirgaceae bacterium]|nr:formylglycine-generating enzyme family protein [Salinivirgaceae bacterium]